MIADDSLLSSPHVIRALFLTAKPGKSWGEDEDPRLVAGFDAGTPVAAPARAHDRSAGAITSRLIRLGRLQVSNQSAFS